MKNKAKEIKKVLEQIRVVRKQKGLTQEKVASIIGVERSTYVRKESGAIPLTLSEFTKVAKYLEIDYNISNGRLELHPKVPGELMQLVQMMETVSKNDRSYIVDNMKNLIKYTKRLR